MSNTKLLVILMGACAAVALPVGAFYLNPVLIIAGAIALIAMFVSILSLVARAYVAKKDAERVLAYKALGAWGDFADPDADAFIQGWLDQVLNPAVPAPVHRTEAAKAAYQSGWIASRDRDLDAPSTADRVL